MLYFITYVCKTSTYFKRKTIVEPMPYTTAILKVTQNENSWAADDLICFISDFHFIRKQSFEQKHRYLCPLFY